MKLLGIDYGTKRIGIAFGDTETRFAFPLQTISDDDAVGHIATIAQQESVDLIVVGMPYALQTKGNTGTLEEEVTDFVANIRAKLSIPVEIEDERLTSAMVEKQHRESGDQQTFDRDAMAAAAILQSYMERMTHDLP